MNSQMRPSPRIGIVVISAIPDDPRVRRQGDLFAGCGWSVRGFGLAGARSIAPAWPISAPASASAPIARRNNLSLRFWIDNLRRLIVRLALHFGVGDWEAEYWRINPVYADLYRIARQHRCDVWLANDWTALPIARKIAAEQGAVLLYDTHELASDEYSERWRWRLLNRPLTMAIERTCIADAKLVTCVSDRIAERLQMNYGLRERPLTVRNTPRYESIAFRPTGDVVEVLYHGSVAPGRGLESCIRSVAKCARSSS